MSSTREQRKKNTKVKVIVRSRPTSRFDCDSIEFMPDNRTINIHGRKDPSYGRVINNQISDWSFAVDGILHNAAQETAYNYIARDIVEDTFIGYNGTIMCYGQTGAGKTFTTTGATESYMHRGIIPRSLAHIYKEVESRTDEAIQIRISYVEIYNEMMYDLLSTLPSSSRNAPSMIIMENDAGVIEVKGLSCHIAQSEEEALNLLFEGETNRAISEHQLNARSSRSHCVFMIYLSSRSRTETNARYTTSKLNIVDLAGSERIKKTGSEGKVQQEAVYINKSLSFLEQTVIALGDKKRDHIPYRQSKLTHLLKDSIGGNCNMTMVANIWGENTQIEETCSTLRFAQRMMRVPLTPYINEHQDAGVMVKHLEKEIKTLKQELAIHNTLANRGQVNYDTLTDRQLIEISRQVRRYLNGEADEVDVANISQIKAVFEAFRNIVLNLESDTEEKLRQNYILKEKTQVEEALSEKVASLSDTGAAEGVGEPDGQGFGVGVAPSSGKSKKSKRGRSREKTVAKKDGVESQVAKESDVQSEKRVDSQADVVSRGSLTDRPATPPSRSDAFEEFKRESGEEINGVLMENKHTLWEKKNECRDIAKKINSIKERIDETRVELTIKRNERLEEGEYLSDTGEVIIDEAEYYQIKRLKELQQQYRKEYETLTNVRSEVSYCEKLVDQCRQRLLTEFDIWYSKSFLSVNDDFQPTISIIPDMKYEERDDQIEEFERDQADVRGRHPESVAYHNAKNATIARKTYEKAMQQSSYRKEVTDPGRQRQRNPLTIKMDTM